MIRAAAGVTLLFLAGCASLRAPAPVDPQRAWVQRSAALAEVQSWSLKGRFISEGVLDGRGSLRWTQHGEHFDLRLTGPFGFGSAQLLGSPLQVEIRTSRDTWVADDPESALASELGVALPLSGLRHWMLGLPRPGAVRGLELDALGRPLGFSQDGWQLSYADYASVGALDLPMRIEAAMPSQTVTILVRDWQPLAPTVSSGLQ